MVPSSTQQRTAAPSSAQWCPVATRVKTRAKTRVKTQVKTRGDQRHQTVPTSAFLEHIILFTSFFKKGRNVSGDQRLDPDPDQDLKAPKEPLGA